MSTEVIRRNTRKKEILVQAAETLFLQKGIRQVTVEEIVRLANVSKATFYKYFTDKKDILDQVMRKSADAVLEKLQSLLEKGKQGRMTKEDFLKIVDMNEYDQLFQSGLLMEMIEDYPEYVEDFRVSYTDQIMPIFYDLIRMAKIDGIVRMDVDTDVLMIFTQALRKPNIHEDSPVLQRMSFKEFNMKYMDLYLYGVMGSDKRDT
ncbi:TetR/AcrR family transcriptional regulator [Paenibacillus sp. HJGM_3]|uniref:TetR/AcrR family transcriptional regulator n=1 Tax=Paenibacillus sp. HJGM_3 TaxID=3379816 RepID=UPI00385BA609